MNVTNSNLKQLLTVTEKSLHQSYINKRDKSRDHYRLVAPTHISPAKNEILRRIVNSFMKGQFSTKTARRQGCEVCLGQSAISNLK